MQCIVDDLLHAALLELLALARLGLAQLDVAKRDKIAKIRFAVGCQLQGLVPACCTLLAFEVDGAVERRALRPSGVTEVLVEVAEGLGGGEVRVRDAVTRELEDTLEELSGRQSKSQLNN
jgi:hypothetical protein